MNLLAKYNSRPVFLYEFAYFSVDDFKMGKQEWIGMMILIFTPNNHSRSDGELFVTLERMCTSFICNLHCLLQLTLPVLPSFSSRKYHMYVPIIYLLGAYHESELQFIFGEPYLNYSNHLRSYDDPKISDLMMKVWGDFIRHG
jgi:hypothetical protein